MALETGQRMRWFEKGIYTPGIVIIKAHATRIHYWDGTEDGEVRPRGRESRGSASSACAVQPATLRKKRSISALASGPPGRV